MTGRFGPGLCTWRCLPSPCRTDFCDCVCEVVLHHRRRFHLVEFSTFACIRCPLHRWCPGWKRDAFDALDATSSSGYQFPTVELCYRPAFRMHDLSPLNGFYSYERYIHYPLVACLDLFPVRGKESCPAVRSLQAPFSADLILPYLTVALVETQVLLTDGANCRVTIRGPSSKGMGS